MWARVWPSDRARIQHQTLQKIFFSKWPCFATTADSLVRHGALCHGQLWISFGVRFTSSSEVAGPATRLTPRVGVVLDFAFATAITASEGEGVAAAAFRAFLGQRLLQYLSPQEGSRIYLCDAWRLRVFLVLRQVVLDPLSATIGVPLLRLVTRGNLCTSFTANRYSELALICTCNMTPWWRPRKDRSPEELPAAPRFRFGAQCSRDVPGNTFQLTSVLGRPSFQEGRPSEACTLLHNICVPRINRQNVSLECQCMPLAPRQV